VTLTARRERFRLESGREIDGYTLNGQSPGPLIEARVGQLVQVRLINDSVPDGVTLHWHGVDVPNAADGVAGVTQDAVTIGQEYIYRFVADQVGTFWYHSHQVSHTQVVGGLLGPLVIRPATPTAEVTDVVALTHIYAGVRTLNGHEEDIKVTAQPGGLTRVRVINTDNGPTSAWVTGAAGRLVAVDGTDLNGPTPFQGKRYSSPRAEGLTLR
jgi:FtsP/CotA-like multicopper oxidase with cupredoxin domain